MRIRVNGQEREVAEGATLVDLLADLKLPPDRVAVERNREIVRRDQYASVRLSEGDTLEIVQIVGGG